MSATVKELLKSDSSCESYAQIKKGIVFYDSQCSTHVMVYRNLYTVSQKVSQLMFDNNLIGCHPFSPTNHLLIENHRSLIQICITPSLESTPGFFPSASPVMSRLTSSFTCQLISIIITTLIIHHSFTLSLQAPFQQILPTLDFFYLPDCLHDNGTGPDLSCSSFYF